ncbi:Reverse transcriptase domain [Cinara cedri]|uniref:Reverse transcriptase domain n=1 Tax=Cinara cedri TaxID=506608 RepID=A0A5E4MWC9_9HEMI|nr:Reverse transcriptase domain [Cinara cedri]
MNWKKFEDDIQKQINLKTKLKSPEDIEDAIENLTSLIQHSAWNASTPIPAKPKSLNLPSYVRDLIVQKRRARAVWQNNILPSYKQIYNNLNAKLKRTLSKIRSDSFSSWSASLVTKNGSLWRATRNCLKQKVASYPLKNNDNTWCTSDIGKPELFRTHLACVFQPHPDIFNPQFTEEVKDFLTTPLPVYLPPKAFSPNDISRCILSFPLRKSPGFDLITAEIARQLPKKAIIFLTYIINSILRLTYFPLQWKLSIIILFPKPDKPIENTSSYRPISLLPFFSKLCEKLILKRIMPIINEKHILPDTQFGFRNSHSTIHQIHRLVDTISLTLEKKYYCPTVFLDVAQAFDRSYLENRHFATRVGIETSEVSPIIAGVPQGAILSPILFNIYSADQPTTPNTSVAEFADEKAIFTTHSDPTTASNYLQNHLNLLSTWYTKWRIKKKPRDTPAKCALCNGDHPANYRGCRIHKQLQQLRQSNQTNQNRKYVNNTNNIINKNNVNSSSDSNNCTNGELVV